MIKDLGTLKYILGIEVVGFKKGIVISYRKYTLGLLKAIRKIGAKPVDIPRTQCKELFNDERSFRDWWGD